jgi:hypothetical protein
VAGWGARIIARSDLRQTNVNDEISDERVVSRRLAQENDAVGPDSADSRPVTLENDRVGAKGGRSHSSGAGRVAITFAIFIQARTVESMIHVVEAMPAPTPGTPPGPPPAEFFALGKRAQNGGIFLTVLLVLIVFFMVVKPQF